jgi:hypothetical protein
MHHGYHKNLINHSLDKRRITIYQYNPFNPKNPNSDKMVLLPGFRAITQDRPYIIIENLGKCGFIKTVRIVTKGRIAIRPYINLFR